MRELIIILLVVLLVFGAKKLRTIGADLGAAVKGFKKSMDNGDSDESVKQIRQESADAEFPETGTAKQGSTTPKSGDRSA